MSLILLESFDKYANAGDITLAGWIIAETYSGGISIITGRTGQGLNTVFSTIIGQTDFYRQLPSTAWDSTFTVGFAFQWYGAPSYICELRADTLATTHARLTVGAGGELQAYAGPSLPLIGTSSIILDTSVWYYVEFQVVLSASAGSVKVNVDGVSQISSTSIDTKNGGTASVFDSIWFGPGGDGNISFDDMYITNSLGSANTSFLGDTKVIWILPAGNGAVSQLTNDLGNSTNNFSHVNSTTTQETTFVQSATAGNEDVYTMQMLAGPGTISGLQTVMLGDKNNAGARTLTPVIREVSTDYAGTAVPLNENSPSYLTQIYEDDPGTSAQWTISGFNNAEFGARVE